MDMRSKVLMRMKDSLSPVTKMAFATYVGIVECILEALDTNFVFTITCIGFILVTMTKWFIT